jgi:hypothetical protein
MRRRNVRETPRIGNDPVSHLLQVGVRTTMEQDAPPNRVTPGQRSQGGGPRSIGPTRDELLGQRARKRSSASLSDAVFADDDGPVAVPELPTLEDGVYLLEPETDGSRSRRETVLTPLQGLALDTALSEGGDAVWVDAQGHATSHTLSSVAPSERALQRVHVARAFTTHQHHSLVDQVARWLRGEPAGPFGAPATDRPAVVVCPAVDALYRGGELPTRDAKRQLTRAVAQLSGLARYQGIPVVLTRTRADDFADPVAQASTTISVERTKFGPRFACPTLEFETLVYPGEGTVQTTLAFWQQVLAERHPEAVTADTQAPEPITAGPDGLTR